MNEMRQQLSKCGAYKLYHTDVYMPQELIDKVMKKMKQQRSFKFSKHLKYGQKKYALKDINKMVSKVKEYTPETIATQFGEVSEVTFVVWSNDGDEHYDHYNRHTLKFVLKNNNLVVSDYRTKLFGDDYNAIDKEVNKDMYEKGDM